MKRIIILMLLIMSGTAFAGNLKLTFPNGGEKFGAGGDVNITWEGVSPNDTVRLDYSVDDGLTWNTITEKATGLVYNWKNIPKYATDNCKIRVSQKDTINSQNVCGTLKYTLGGHTRELKSASWSPDGKKVVTSSSDGTAIIWDAISGVRLAILLGHSGKVISATWNSDGSKIATVAEDGNVKIWDGLTGKNLQTFLWGVPDDFEWGCSLFCSWSPEGSKIAIFNTCRNRVAIWDVNTGSKLIEFAKQDRIYWSPDGTKLVTRGTEDSVTIWNSHNGNKILTLEYSAKEFGDDINNINWSPNGSKIATMINEKIVMIWDAQTGKKLFELAGKNYLINCSWSPDSRRIAGATYDSICYVWNALDGTKLVTLIDTIRGFGKIKWSPDGTKLATATRYPKVSIWDAQIGIKQLTLNNNVDYVSDMNWSPDGSKIVTSVVGNIYATIWDAKTGAELLILKDDYYTKFSMSPDGSEFVTASNNSATIWDAEKGIKRHVLDGHADRINEVYWSPDGSKIATSSRYNTCIIWDAATGSRLYTLEEHEDQITSIAWSPDGSKLATVSADPIAIIWDAASGKKLCNLLVDDKDIFIHVSWSPDGSKVATTRLDLKNSVIWDALTGKNIRTLLNNFMPVPIYRSTVWSPDGKRIASITNGPCFMHSAVSGDELYVLGDYYFDRITALSWNSDGSKICLCLSFPFGKISINEPKDGKQELLLQEYIGVANQIKWSPDDTKIAVASSDACSTIWDVNTGIQLLTLPEYIGEVAQIAWNRNGNRVVTAANGRIKMWNVGNPVVYADQSDSGFSIDTANVGSVEDIILNNKTIISISPNPAKDIITVTAKITEADTKIKLIDIAGKVILEINCPVDKSKAQGFIIDLTNVPAGIYFIEIKSANYSQIEKVMVEK